MLESSSDPWKLTGNSAQSVCWRGTYVQLLHFQGYGRRICAVRASQALWKQKHVAAAIRHGSEDWGQGSHCALGSLCGRKEDNEFRVWDFHPACLGINAGCSLVTPNTPYSFLFPISLSDVMGSRGLNVFICEKDLALQWGKETVEWLPVAVVVKKQAWVEAGPCPFGLCYFTGDCTVFLSWRATTGVQWDLVDWAISSPCHQMAFAFFQGKWGQSCFWWDAFP